MRITAAEVSRRWKIDKSKVSRALNSGDLTADRGPNGRGWAIEVAEAERWVSSLSEKPVRGKSDRSATPVATPNENTVELIELRAEVQSLRKMNEMLEADKEDWKQQAKNAQQLLLSDQRTDKKSGLLSRLFGSSES